ncbi:uncharacterized protein LOC126846816 [Adelges cooleyi]|uniref:uncharacterized protein LOC126846816 n=1 Tax=Adelges cooleyi TaxID=133065 RepID=UPI0021803C3E|nr:uncharacterized protein LOC126846816 [Adelges cooleyi]XP_050442585.1 uncharacterized protein LOC126846816 [Adelges cooleyi]XP_050442593.1 uncharacterized protein LOC126846816 [Adelges cooleyi]
MSPLTCKYTKRQMKLNILRHKQKLLQVLTEINDTVIAPNIKIDAKDLEQLDLSYPKEIKKEIKEETTTIKVECIDSSCSSISDLSEIKCNNKTDLSSKVHSSSNNSLTRRSIRLIAAEQGHKYKSDSCKSNDSLNNQYMYESDGIVDIESVTDCLKETLISLHGSQSATKFPQNDSKRYRSPNNRSEHNAKERMCRELIANLFSELSKLCSYLECNRRIPSKHSILLAAKKECDLLALYEKRLILEKEKRQNLNYVLLKKLAYLQNRVS